MAIKGSNFIAVNGAERFDISTHALDRLTEFTGFTPTRGLASIYFANSRQVGLDEMHRMGYHPGYERRKVRGIASWYFRFAVFGQELIAVIATGRTRGSLIWVTTYPSTADAEPARGQDLLAV